MNENRDIRAWFIWLIVMTSLTMVIRNPYYLLLLFAIAEVIRAQCRHQDGAVTIHVLKIAPIVFLFSALYFLLFVHVGEVVLFRLPLDWPLVGGPITLEAAVFGLVNGLFLLTLLNIFVTFNAVVSVSELVKYVPPLLHDIGVVLLIAITYIPETTHQLKRIREAQAIRGNQLDGLSNWRPIIIPLLIGGLERAMALAETMVSRGYGSTADNQQPVGLRLWLIFSLVITFLGWTYGLWFGGYSWLLMALGGLMIVFLLWQQARQSPRTRYEVDQWRPLDTLMVLAALLPLLLALLPLTMIDKSSLAFIAFQGLNWPSLDIVFVLALLALALPALTPRGRRVN